MTLRSIDILDFKNISAQKLDFCGGVNCLLGLNGMGKSNLLEAIYLLSMARPLRQVPETALIRHGAEALMVRGDYTSDSGAEETVSCGIVRGKGKSIRRNGKEYQRISEHIGKFPVVAVTPADSGIVTDSGETRRRLMDMVISQADPSYLSRLIRYNRALDSRNKMLRAGVRDAILYESIEALMAETAKAIHTSRKDWVAAIAQDFDRYYRAVAGGTEKASLEYKSVLNDSTMEDVLEANRQRDLALGFSSAGIHRDDLLTRLDDWSMRRLGSQGQIKTFTVALRLAIYDYLRKQGGETPILLLDDIFDKLDASRVARIIAEVSGSENFGQIFITDTNREHIDETLGAIRSQSRVFEVKDGQFNQL